MLGVFRARTQRSTRFQIEVISGLPTGQRSVCSTLQAMKTAELTASSLCALSFPTCIVPATTRGNPSRKPRTSHGQPRDTRSTPRRSPQSFEGSCRARALTAHHSNAKHRPPRGIETLRVETKGGLPRRSGLFVLRAAPPDLMGFPCFSSAS